MRTLVIDCATPALSLALFEDDRLVAHRHETIGRGHAEALVPAIAALPGSGRADRVAVDVGPGSFTGIRVGIAAARALGLAWRVPVEGYGCLGICAARVARDRAGPGTTIAMVMTGGHGELFWQRFDAASLAPLSDPASAPIAALAATLHDETVHGSGAEALVERRGYGTARPCLPDARSWPHVPARDRGLPPIALYGRGADALPMASVSA